MRKDLAVPSLFALWAVLILFGFPDYAQAFRYPTVSHLEWLEIRIYSDLTGIIAVVTAATILRRSQVIQARSLAIFTLLLSISCSAFLDGIAFMSMPTRPVPFILLPLAILVVVSTMMLSPWFTVFRFNQFARDLATELAPGMSPSVKRDRQVFAGGICALGAGGILTFTIRGDLIFGVWVLVLGGILTAIIWGGAALLRDAYPFADRAQREAIAWLVQGVSLSSILLCLWLVFTVVSYLPGQAPPSWWNRTADSIGAVLLFAAPFCMVSCIALSVFYKGALDPKLVVRKTVFYGMLALFITVLFAALESLVSNYVAAAIGLPSSLGTVVAGVTTAFIVGPLRHRLERVTRQILPAVGDEASISVTIPVVPLT